MNLGSGPQEGTAVLELFRLAIEPAEERSLGLCATPAKSRGEPSTFRASGFTYSLHCSSFLG